MAEARVASAARDLASLADRERAAVDERDVALGGAGRGGGARDTSQGARSRRSSPTTGWSGPGSRRRSGPRARRASGCERPTTGLAPPRSPPWRRGSGWTRCASSCSSSSPGSARSGCGTLPRQPGSTPTALGRAAADAEASEADAAADGVIGVPGDRAGEANDGDPALPTGETAVFEADRSTPWRRAGRRRPRKATRRRRVAWRRSGAASTSSARRTRSRSTSTVRSATGSSRWTTQDRDLRDAIAKTRTLIAELDVLIATQFRTTFAALEVAFDARFQQLFGGGFAQALADRPRGPLRHRHRDHRPAAGQEAAGAGDALGRRARADGGGAAVRDARGPTRAVLRARRGRCRARRGQRRPVHGGASGARGPDPVHRHHPQPRHDRGPPTPCTA